MIYWIILSNLITAFLVFRISYNKNNERFNRIFKMMLEDLAAGLYPDDYDGVKKVEKLMMTGAINNLKSKINEVLS